MTKKRDTTMDNAGELLCRCGRCRVHHPDAPCYICRAEIEGERAERKAKGDDPR